MSKTGKVQALRGNTILGKDTQTHDKEKLEIFSAQQNKTKTTEIISEKKMKQKKIKKYRGRRGTMEQNKKKGRKNKKQKMTKNGWEVQSLKGYRFRTKFKRKKNSAPPVHPTNIHPPTSHLDAGLNTSSC